MHVRSGSEVTSVFAPEKARYADLPGGPHKHGLDARARVQRFARPPLKERVALEQHDPKSTSGAGNGSGQARGPAPAIATSQAPWWAGVTLFS